MTDISGYEDDAVAVPQSADKLAQLGKLGQEFLRKQKAVADAEAALAKAKEEFAKVAEVEIPEVLASVGLGGITLPDGREITLVENLYANISEDRKDAAHDWLEKNNQGGVIKRQVVVAYNREQEADAAALVQYLSTLPTPVNYRVDRSVHAQTLKKLVRELMEEGTLPQEAQALFGVFRKKVAEIAEAKKRGGKRKGSNPFAD